MKRFYVSVNNIPELNDNVSCIGNFDGVHLGHQSLIKKTIETAKEKGLFSYAITFDKTMRDYIPGVNADNIQTFEARLNVFESLGLDGVIIVEFNKEMMSVSADDFIDTFLRKMNVKTLVCGMDYSFGYKGLGNYKLLMEKGVDTIVCDDVIYYGKKVSSTRIRDNIKKGNLRLAGRLLGYDYNLFLKVTDCLSKKNKFLIRAIPEDDSLIIPDNGTYNSIDCEIRVTDGVFEFISNNPLSVNDNILMVF